MASFQGINEDCNKIIQQLCNHLREQFKDKEVIIILHLINYGLILSYLFLLCVDKILKAHCLDFFLIAAWPNGKLLSLILAIVVC